MSSFAPTSVERPTPPVPDPGFGHVWALTDEHGTFEHAELAVPRLEHGYCTDDVARVLVVACREPNPSPMVRSLASSSLRFVIEAQDANGAICNRRAASGAWEGRPSVEDCWGRSLWGLGTAAARGGPLSAQASDAFDRGASLRSPHVRSMAFAALGAAEVLTVDPGHGPARALLAQAAARIGVDDTSATWPWPEPRLTYANAVLPEVLLAAGHALDREHWLDRGLHLLGWLLDRETRAGHVSVVPATGAGPDEVVPRFDQQPIEVAALADACARAWACTGDRRWADGVRATGAWFQGENDIGATMWDPTSGGGFDGLMETGVNANQGAESTLAMISTFQQARLVAAVEA